MGESTQDSDRTVNVNQNGESLKAERALAVIICALCHAPSKVAQEVDTILVDSSHCFGRKWNKQVSLSQ